MQDPSGAFRVHFLFENGAVTVLVHLRASRGRSAVHEHRLRLRSGVFLTGARARRWIADVGVQIAEDSLQFFRQFHAVLFPFVVAVFKLAC